MDKNFDIRGREFGDSIHLSDKIIQNMFSQRNLEHEGSSAKFLQTLFNTFTTVIDARVPEAENINYVVGQKLGG